MNISAGTTVPARPLVVGGAGDQAPFQLDQDDVLRLTVSILADEIARRTKRSVPPQELATWTADTLIDEDGIGFDSLARIDAAIRLNQFFHLHEVGLEDYLLRERTLGGWCAIISKSLAVTHERITFQTSGTTGEPEACMHEVVSLQAEIKAQTTLYPNVRRIVGFVPPHHIYGFLTTVMLPRVLGAPFVDARAWGPGAWNRELRDGDLVVATPFHWDLLAKGIRKLPNGVNGLTSTAPMPAPLKTKLLKLGLTDLIELYGSSQTAGIGWRSTADDDFRLFDHLVRVGDTVARCVDDGTTLPVQDKLVWTGPQTFRPEGRLDKAVQIGGVNVHLGKVEEALRSLDMVKDAAVRCVVDDNRSVLDAFVVPTDEAPNGDELVAQLRRACADELRSVERPSRFTIGSAVPVNDMGKRRDW